MNASLIFYDYDEMKLPRWKKTREQPRHLRERRERARMGGEDADGSAQHAAPVTEKFTMLPQVTAVTTTTTDGGRTE